jgi:hypothetical protein
LTLLAACQMQAPQKTGPEVPPAAADAPTPITGDAIAVTPLDGPATSAPPVSGKVAPGKPAASPPAVTVQVPDKTTPRPKPRPADLSAAQNAPPANPPANPPTQTPDPQAAAKPVPPEQALCEKAGGQWAEMPASSGRICLHRTRDAGKVCHRKRDCQGECLARSGTCSPITPLVGCNDVLQADGTEVTLCLQ